jgi:phage shock protein A
LRQRLRSRVDEAIRWRAAEAIEPVAQRAQDLHDRLARVERSAEWSANELRRIAPQVAAIEARLADLDDRLRQADAAGPATEAERTMLDLISTEHQRVRERLAAVSSYEERLRRLENGSSSSS